MERQPQKQYKAAGRLSSYSQGRDTAEKATTLIEQLKANQ